LHYKTSAASHLWHVYDIGVVDTDPAARIILDNLMHVASQDGASLGQIRMWLVPQKAENEYDYSINKGYFEMMLLKALRDLIENGYITSSLPDGVDDSDVQHFSLTEKGAKHLQELAAASKIEQGY
jgi:hypothetical protein